MTLASALLCLVQHPVERLIHRWNWKAAFFSSLIRGIIFLLANLRAGWRAAVGAMLAEWIYRALTSGFYGAITQVLGEAEPEWQGALAASHHVVGPGLPIYTNGSLLYPWWPEAAAAPGS